ncbi:hypothetical protein A3Q56_00065 [Intoshia linei]|uniref:HTH psq-type domain-containing protein n=1 Tax=Intoshia linei TaxID=1819745 RepID=A0A177BD92_9BILA|nr:hypothetical protein A3Q56_00065 [Intoshia linei]
MRHLTHDKKFEILALFKEGRCRDSLATRYSVSQTTIGGLVSRNDPKKNIKSSRPRKLNENHINFVVERVNESPHVSSIQLATELTEEVG